MFEYQIFIWQLNEKEFEIQKNKVNNGDLRMPVQTNVQLTPNVSRTIEEKLLGYILLGQT